MPSRAASARTRRVSSAAISSAAASSARSLGEASSSRPMGTAASVRTPADVHTYITLVRARRDPSNICPMTATAADSTAADAGRLTVLRSRLVAPMPQDGIWGWIWPLLVTAFGGFLRFNRLSVPRALIFDETYYVKDAWSILHHGTEWVMASTPNDPNLANQLIQAGHTNIFATCTHAMYVGDQCGEYVVQPELGKELIAIGEAMFGLNSFGWRFSSAVFGTLAILLISRIARRMTRSTLLGCIAGLLMSLDGLEFVLSRTGILDIFLMFFVLAAFGSMVIDRDVSRERLAALVTAGQSEDPSGPRLGIRK